MSRQQRHARLIALALASTAASGAEEVAPFRLTGYDGYVSLRYVRDQSAIDLPATAPGGPLNMRQAQSGWRNEVFVGAHGYVYHPDFLTLDFGGGPVFYREAFTDLGETVSRGTQYNLSARATFLKDKPYRGTMFYEHLNPGVVVSPTEVLLQENARYGVEISVLEPATTVPVTAGFTRSTSQGRGADRRLDDRIDQVNVTATRRYGDTGQTQAKYQASEQYSTSGAADLPVQTSTATSRALDVDTRLALGSERQYDFRNLVALKTQKYELGLVPLPGLSSAQALFELRSRHTEQWKSYATYNQAHSAQGDLVSAARIGTAGIGYAPIKELEFGFGAHRDATATHQVETGGGGLDASVRYEQALPLGVAQASYVLRRDQRHQEALAPQTSVIGERVVLTGGAYIALTRPYALAASVVVNNATRTQAYEEGIDYLLWSVGSETRVQRLIGGRILDGEAVLIDYDYDVGGTYRNDLDERTLSLGWQVGSYANVYFRRFEATPRVTSGAPTFQLNTVRDTTVGLRLAIPVQAGLAMTVGGNLESEHRLETVAPFRRRAGDAFVQVDEPVFGLLQARLAVRRTRIDADIPALTMNLRGYDVRLWTRRWFGLDLSAASGYERDDGGLLPRYARTRSFNVQWQQRKFSLTASLLRVREAQGGYERDRTLLQVYGRREL